MGQRAELRGQLHIFTAFAHFLSVFTPGPAVDWAHSTVLPGSPSLWLGNSTGAVHSASMVYTRVNVSNLAQVQAEAWSSLGVASMKKRDETEAQAQAENWAVSRLFPGFACTLATDTNIKLYTSVDSRVVCNIKHRSYSHHQYFIQGKASDCQGFNLRVKFFVSKKQKKSTSTLLSNQYVR